MIKTEQNHYHWKTIVFTCHPKNAGKLFIAATNSFNEVYWSGNVIKILRKLMIFLGRLSEHRQGLFHFVLLSFEIPIPVNRKKNVQLSLIYYRKFILLQQTIRSFNKSAVYAIKSSMNWWKGNGEELNE